MVLFRGRDGADIASATFDGVVHVDIGVSRCFEDFVLVSKDEVEVVEQQLFFFFLSFFVKLRQFLLLFIFLFHFVADQFQTGILALA